MKRYLFVIFVSFCILVTGVIWFAENQHSQVVESRKRVATERLGKLRAALEGQINSSLVTARALQAEIKLSPDISPERYRLLMQELIDGDVPVRHVALAPNLIIEFVYPLAPNKAALGFDYRTSPAQFESVQEAIQKKQIVIDGPVNLIQGGWALIARAPVFINDNKLWGMIAVVIDIGDLIASSGLDSVDDYLFALKKENGNGDHLFDFGDASLWQQDYVAIEVAVSTGKWILALAPKNAVWAHRGSIYWIIIVAGLLLSFLMTAFMYNLVTAQSRLRSALVTIDHQAHFDSITDLPNRRAFVDYLDQLTQKGREQHFAILFIDLDHFKEVNDNLGHDAGDELLVSVSDRLRNQLRGSDFIARIGGDEFVVVINRFTSHQIINDLASQINRQLSEPFNLRQNQIQTTCSIGIALYPDDGIKASELLKNADLAMYAAKTAGRRTHYFFNDELREQTERQNAIHKRMREGLKRHEFYLVYQPIIDFSTGKISKCEALLRWQDEDGNMISPAEFIPVAERTGLIHELGQFVLEQACVDWAVVHKSGYPIEVSINRSERELNDMESAKRWLSCISQHGIPNTSITFEITESLLMSNKQRQLQILHYLRSQGVQLAIDDFGTGYSSINYLQRYPVDYIKIDRSFLSQAPQNKVQVALLDALLQVARALDINVIAEGVETRQQWELLQRQRCDFAQGYFISEPLPLNELLKFLKDWQF
ncbi:MULTISPECIES: putative bifunctional diguanylate cyclase/phosphodiesterase [Idiomarina]|jgi:diguanylate cyclase (GGDEF)-like protein|uniref:Signaling protein with a sensor domain, CHASE, GGDEF and EAL domains n=1 Tax=Idiomarina loihiensis (strain ATCC BAA-735 / DSM 15497 / L2-TR) TaxID=283942 RepID=Q5R0L9_IDILO|nr:MULTISPECIES: EAL domain-containing protein [Idiomarina]AAV81269.1 Signaling protein with a sensor domain, CHASE, GGDEF and EAL domains [Idiomarina loihiensis L2TR]AGM35294.1 signal protein [Idiomarina loihiensis GSL 199]PHQ92485.1 MAG: bifunctional diguanylate cyclase/phosphodiesterase [Idiomarina sp.]